MITIDTPDHEKLTNPGFASLSRIWFQYRDKANGQKPGRGVFFQAFPAAIQSYCFLARITRDPFDVSYTLVGSALERLYGQKLDNVSLRSIYSPWIRAGVYKSYQHADENGLPLYDRHRFSTIGRALGYERLLMPMADSDGYGWAVTVVFPTEKDIKEASDWRKLVEETPWL